MAIITLTKWGPQGIGKRKIWDKQLHLFNKHLLSQLWARQCSNCWEGTKKHDSVPVFMVFKVMREIKTISQDNSFLLWKMCSILQTMLNTFYRIVNALGLLGGD